MKVKKHVLLWFILLQTLCNWMVHYLRHVGLWTWYSLKGIVIDYRWSCLVGYGHHICWLCLDIVLIVVNCLCMITWQMVAYKNICIPLMVISFSLYACIDSYSEIRSYLHLQMLAFSHISSMVFLSLFSCIVVMFIFGGLKANLSTAFFL